MTLSTLVKIELLADPELANLRLETRTAQGVVTLSGTVRSQADLEKAVALARRVKGVRDVKSELKVEAPRYQ